MRKISNEEVLRFAEEKGFKPLEEQLKLQKSYDKLKNKYCEKNKIKLVRIPYWEFKNIEKILGKEVLG